MNWSYIAGFFDGEGSVSHNGRGFRVSIPQTSEKVLRNIERFVGYGTIIYNPRRKIHWKDTWIYYIARQNDVNKFLKKLRPFLIVKKKLVKDILPKLNGFVKQQKLKAKMFKHRKQEGKKLRAKGLTYREIGKILKVDWGYARRLILNLK